VIKYVRKISETHLCNCGKGEITLNKITVTGLGPNQSQPKESIASIIPCRVCGSTIDNNGTELDKKKRKNSA
jgi:hypothetical protein